MPDARANSHHIARNFLASRDKNCREPENLSSADYLSSCQPRDQQCIRMCHGKHIAHEVGGKRMIDFQQGEILANKTGGPVIARTSLSFKCVAPLNQ